MNYLEEPSNSFIRDEKDKKIKDFEKSIPLIGIPWDWSTAGKPGARFAPQSIRNELYSLRTDVYELNEIKFGFNDLGNVRISPGDLNETSRRIISVCDDVFKKIKEKNPVIFLGGDHSITKSILLSLSKFYNKIGLIIFDAHYDLREVKEGLTSGSWLNELLKDNKEKFNVIEIGISNYSNPSYMKEIAKKYGIKVFYRDQIIDDLKDVFYEINKVKENTDGIYISIDMDHLDQSFAPGVNSPTALGMYPHETIKIINEITRNSKILGIDTTEVSPPYDINNNTSRLAAKLLLYSINSYLGNKNG
ncbi:arginase family hydrolase, arginase/agmainase/formiminoglutamate hydrolase [Caldisphaera lagunensis DSM 15908]|uniref:Arginase family hydrolase, arginase/agmainase/formiminoglutamate hydrolase n=1 Tax=Caldisphaera lagunensis (strain DSM 15908 / JCM 11604 / ANMR 0165 / IC-154) TaxID=1056495 RepID=L0A7R2_CALLD|nr:agmatinase family protein [Caldisphaera lagunensis]AFZ69866.1 arginase family hydrolase, arginase/agmainase/formiminoglutamate hydrolase [Caldisphaera lagunensis DSM 15908]